MFHLRQSTRATELKLFHCLLRAHELGVCVCAHACVRACVCVYVGVGVGG